MAEFYNSPPLPSPWAMCPTPLESPDSVPAALIHQALGIDDYACNTPTMRAPESVRRDLLEKRMTLPASEALNRVDDDNIIDADNTVYDNLVDADDTVEDADVVGTDDTVEDADDMDADDVDVVDTDDDTRSDADTGAEPEKESRDSSPPRLVKKLALQPFAVGPLLQIPGHMNRPPAAIKQPRPTTARTTDMASQRLFERNAPAQRSVGKQPRYTDRREALAQENKKKTQALKSLKATQYLQNSTHLIISRRGMERVIRACLVDPLRDRSLRITPEAIEAIRHAAEARLVELFETSTYATHHANRLTLKPSDIQLVETIRSRQHR